MRTVAQILSFIFHPLLLPVYAFLIFHQVDPFFSIHFNPELNFQFLAIFIFNTLLAPLLAVFFLYQNETINNLSDPDKKGRIAVVLIVLTMYIFTYVFFKRLSLPAIFYELFLSIIIVIGIGGVITIWYKISMHCIGIGGLVGAQCALFIKHHYMLLSLLLLLIMLAGIIATSRIIIKAHSHNQVYLGLALGFFGIAAILLIH